MTEVSEDPRIPTVLEEKITAIWFAFGNDLEKYVRTVREYDAKRDHKTKIFCCCNSVDEALRAANEWKVDVIVAQGKISAYAIRTGVTRTHTNAQVSRLVATEAPTLLPCSTSSLPCAPPSAPTAP